MRREVTKEYDNKVEVRDYDVETCISNHENLEIIYDGDRMTLKPDELVSKKASVSPIFFSKTGGKDYRLYGYVWNPDKIQNDEV